MSEITTKTIELLEMLPENDQLFAFEFIKKLVLAWDPDYSRLTNTENEKLNDALKSPSINSKNIDWDNLDEINLD